MGKIKRKGAYEYNVQWHQDCSALIIPKAAEAALVRGEDIRTFITNHVDNYDFMCRAKVPRSNRLVMRWPEYDNAEIPLASIIRYYVSNSGGTLVKVAPPTGEPGTWKRAAKVSDTLFAQVMAEIRGVLQQDKGDVLHLTHTPSRKYIAPDGATVWTDESWHVVIDGKHIVTDSRGTPWDERIHTKNKSKHDIREMGICVGWRVTDCSNVANFDRSTVNYDYYVEQAEKLVKPLLEGTTL